MPIVDQYTYLGVEIQKNDSWDAHINKVIGKGKAQIGKMEVILRESHLDTRIKRCILMKVIVPKLEYAGEVWEGTAKLVKIRNSTNDSSKENTLMFKNGE